MTNSYNTHYHFIAFTTIHLSSNSYPAFLCKIYIFYSIVKNLFDIKFQLHSLDRYLTNNMLHLLMLVPI